MESFPSQLEGGESGGAWVGVSTEADGLLYTVLDGVFGMF